MKRWALLDTVIFAQELRRLVVRHQKAQIRRLHFKAPRSSNPHLRALTHMRTTSNGNLTTSNNLEFRSLKRLHLILSIHSFGNLAKTICKTRRRNRPARRNVWEERAVLHLHATNTNLRNRQVRRVAVYIMAIQGTQQCTEPNSARNPTVHGTQQGRVQL
jgi:hypothetical protein